MGEADQKGAVDTQPPASEKANLDREPAKIETKTEDEAAGQPPEPVEKFPDPQTSENVPVKEEGDTGQDSVFPGTTDGLNFDSVLNDTGGSNSFNLSLDFGDDDMGNQAFLSGSAFGSAAPPATEKTTSLPQESSAGAVPAGGSAFDMELQKTEGNSHASSGQNTGIDDMMVPGESSFDDLFMETENLGENGSGDLNQLEGDSLMNISELDDNWFN